MLILYLFCVACYTKQGQQCLFPFTYRNESITGVQTQVNFTKCSSLDLHTPWCPTQFEADGITIKEWGECAEDCPAEEPMIACLTEPIFPDWVDDTDGEDYVNFTTTYVQGSGDITLEVRTKKPCMVAQGYSRRLLFRSSGDRSSARETSLNVFWAVSCLISHSTVGRIYIARTLNVNHLIRRENVKVRLF